MDHNYKISVKWTGNTGKGTVEYKAYERSYILSAEGKPNLEGSSDPAFRGDAAKWNPEELLLAALSTCHMLWYLHICATNKIVITQYEDHPVAVMKLETSGAGQFTEATLNPRIVITDAKRIGDAEKLHHEAHEKCFIARSVNFPVKVVPNFIA
jgi:organic hydroperoxide reductase OsmC/OhrA